MNPEENTNVNPPELDQAVEEAVGSVPTYEKPVKPEMISRTPIKPLRTYQGDVDEIIGKNKISTTHIVMAEQKRKIEEPQKVITPPEPIIDPKTRNTLFVTLGIMLTVAGLGAVGYVYYLKANETVPVEQRAPTIVNYSSESAIRASDVSRETLIKGIVSQKMSFQSQPNSILYLNITESDNKKAGLEKILGLIAPHMPPSLTRSFSGDYMIGIYSFDTNEPFILLKVSDYPNSYSGMLRWEKDMFQDLATMFSISLSGTSTPIFIDDAIKNKDLRVMKDASGKTLLLYSFIDKNTLMITKNENIFSALLGKYLIAPQTR